MKKIEALYDNYYGTKGCIPDIGWFHYELHKEPKGKDFDTLIRFGEELAVHLHAHADALSAYVAELKRAKTVQRKAAKKR